MGLLKAWALAGSCLILVAGASAASAAGSLEYAVKASYLTKFAPFVEWPPQAFASPESPLRICVIGNDPFGPLLEELARGQQVSGHPMAVAHMDELKPGVACQILFIGARSDAGELLHEAAGKPMLTVTDGSRGGPAGIIQFVLSDGRVRFVIDEAAAAAAGIKISAKLLQLALRVEQ